MGCSNVEVKYKTTQIDSMCLIYNEEYSVLNLNDCPYDLAINTLDVILKDHKKIDLLLVGYAGAGPYPQTFFEIDDTLSLKSEAEKKKLRENAEKALKEAAENAKKMIDETENAIKAAKEAVAKAVDKTKDFSIKDALAAVEEGAKKVAEGAKKLAEDASH